MAVERHFLRVDVDGGECLASVGLPSLHVGLQVGGDLLPNGHYPSKKEFCDITKHGNEFMLSLRLFKPVFFMPLSFIIYYF